MCRLIVNEAPSAETTSPERMQGFHGSAGICQTAMRLARTLRLGAGCSELLRAPPSSSSELLRAPPSSSSELLLRAPPPSSSELLRAPPSCSSQCVRSREASGGAPA
ncbi:hypothetical protein EYF80_051258 [Liparis tanakae]|uniref:Uncharacterized protein n=1 Tax=Liparis tanakae TaxID=230148 RepID=A0A4Z2FCG1_9TELE|nr:hypothetical protein EYF80_051258 [Liparis tanakae]